MRQTEIELPVALGDKVHLVEPFSGATLYYGLLYLFALIHSSKHSLSLNLQQGEQDMSQARLEPQHHERNSALLVPAPVECITFLLFCHFFIWGGLKMAGKTGMENLHPSLQTHGVICLNTCANH